METHLVTADDQVFQVPLTYRDEPLAGGEASFISEMHHSALGTRYIYDGLGDPLYRSMLAAVTLTGQGEALGLVLVDGRWVMVPSIVRIHGGGWTHERVAVDGFEPGNGSLSDAVVDLSNERFELRVFRRPVAGVRPQIGLTASWPGTANPVVLADIRER
jgi:hypothetical protein